MNKPIADLDRTTCIKGVGKTQYPMKQISRKGMCLYLQTHIHPFLHHELLSGFPLLTQDPDDFLALTQSELQLVTPLNLWNSLHVARDSGSSHPQPMFLLNIEHIPAMVLYWHSTMEVTVKRRTRVTIKIFMTMLTIFYSDTLWFNKCSCIVTFLFTAN